MTKHKRYHRKSRKFRKTGSQRAFGKSRKNRTRRHYPSYKRSFSSNIKARGPSPISASALIPCCMCGRDFPRNDMLVPLACLQKHGERAHRICKDCWWDPQIGFAREDAPHGCPGCKRGLPLNPPLKTRKPTTEEIIIISDD
jgi:hypothetical protein